MTLSPFATHSEQSRGRRFGVSESAARSHFQRDRDRIVHSAAFRKLQHKTQVFVFHEGDYYRSRLTHSLEVAQIARSISRVLKLDEDLAEALALAHDLGHPPFAHAGEVVLQELMAPYGGFDHNANAIRLLTSIEARYADYDGMNLTWETLEGIAKHNGPINEPLPWALKAYNDIHDLELSTHAGPEAQVAALSDDIAYDNHDIEDGLRAGHITLQQLYDLPLIGPHLNNIRQSYPNLEDSRLIYEAKRRLITEMVDDLIVQTQKNIQHHKPKTVEDVRHLGQALVSFSTDLMERRKVLKKFLFDELYRHYRVNRMSSKVKRVTRDLFTLFIREPNCLPQDWQNRTKGPETVETARVVCDFIAGMTDRYAFEEHKKLFDLFSRT